MKTPDLRTKLQKKAEVKIQAVGKKVGTKVKTVKKAYDTAYKKKNDAYLASPKGKKALKILNAGGNF